MSAKKSTSCRFPPPKAIRQKQSAANFLLSKHKYRAYCKRFIRHFAYRRGLFILLSYVADNLFRRKVKNPGVIKHSL